MLLLTYTPPLLLGHTPAKYDPRLSELRTTDIGALIGILKTRFGFKSVELKA